jgi:hypothetical protein
VYFSSLTALISFHPDTALKLALVVNQGIFNNTELFPIASHFLSSGLGL